MKFWVRIRPSWDGCSVYVNTVTAEVAVERDGGTLVGVDAGLARYIARLESGLRQSCEEWDWPHFRQE